MWEVWRWGLGDGKSEDERKKEARRKGQKMTRGTRVAEIRAKRNIGKKKKQLKREGGGRKPEHESKKRQETEEREREDDNKWMKRCRLVGGKER